MTQNKNTPSNRQSGNKDGSSKGTNPKNHATDKSAQRDSESDNQQHSGSSNQQNSSTYQQYKGSSSNQATKSKILEEFYKNIL